MDTTAVRRFMASNVVWPLDKFFIPAGGLTGFLRENLRFKIVLIMTAIFMDPFAAVTVSSLTQLEMNQVRARMRDVVSHVIRQNEFRVAYSPIGVPAQAAWMFHMILTLLRIVGFEGDDITVVANEVAEVRMTEGQPAHEHVMSRSLIGPDPALSGLIGADLRLSGPYRTPSTVRLLILHCR
ncbi:hypothetical protein B0H11DRAFT_2250292 [Mycena galericulata]|nr:hypothetical protein B0H11DRAFT_2250292 [Mycena galericulata]